MMNTKVKQALQSIVQRFKEGDIPKAIAYLMFPTPNIPASKWSLLNRTLMLISGTSDARGFNQWKEVGRHVKKGSKSITILAPRFAKKQTEDKEEPKPILAGFLAVPVFRVEDTDGEPLDYERIELPELPLMEVAQEWGISVKAIPGNYHYSGYFSQDRKEIALASKDETVFFHELAHAAHQRILGQLKKGQNWKQEIVAELAAATLCKIVGKTSKHIGNSYRYIEKYSKEAKLTPWQGCLKVISDTEKVLNLIMNWKPPKELEKPENDERLCAERKAVECESQNLTLKTPTNSVTSSSFVKSFPRCNTASNNKRIESGALVCYSNRSLLKGKHLGKLFAVSRSGFILPAIEGIPCHSTSDSAVAKGSWSQDAVH